MTRSFLIILIIFFCLACTRQNKDQLGGNFDTDEQGKNKKSPVVNLIHANSLTSDKNLKKAFRNKTKRKEGNVLPEASQSETVSGPSDSIFRAGIKYFSNREGEIDLNEPVSRSFLTSTIPPADFPLVIMLSRERFLKISLDNDIFDYTDRFFTNGIRIDLIHPSLSGNPAGRVTIPYWGSGMNYYGLSIVQNLYTPSTTKSGGIIYGDRPYASYLYLGSFKITNDPVKRFRMTSEIDLGIIGPYSLGEYVQKSFHGAFPSNSEPLGWEYQIKNDLVLNYSVTFDKGILSEKWINFNLVSTAMLGTLYTNISGGLLLRAGWMNPYFSNLGISKRSKLKQNHLHQAQGYFFLKGSGKVVGYDATLEGGLLNRSSVYTIPGSEISHLVFQTSVGLVISYGGFQIEAEQFLLSPEFSEGLWHKWGHIGLTFCF
ncbi:MAG: lipid A deacylase LpxR family protein [bacterium]